MTIAETLTKKYRTLLNRYGVNTPDRLAHFWGQLKHESGLIPRQENLNYSTKRLVEVFKRKFDRNKDGWLDENEKLKIREIAGNPQKIGNFIYANVGGNGNEASGDGYKFRGRGHIQITLKDNYKQLSIDTGIDFINNPNLLLEEANSILAALWFWNKNGLNRLADKNNITEITKRINGGYNGLQERVIAVNEYKKIFN